MRCASNVLSVYLSMGKLKGWFIRNGCLKLVKFWWEILTAIRKSPGRSPAISATPPGSTSSKYCKPGQRSDGFSCIKGDAAFAPRNTNPKPLLARWRTTLRDSMIPLKMKIININMRLLFPPLYLFIFFLWTKIYIFFCRGAVALLYCWCDGGCGCKSCCSCCWLPLLPLFATDDDKNVCWSIGCILMTVFLW